MNTDRIVNLFRGEHKRIALGACAGAAVLFVAGGVLIATATAAPGLPTDAREAVLVMNSTKFDRLDDDRKAQYREEAWRLFREMSQEQRRAFMQDEETRRAMGEMRESFLDDMLRRIARGEEVQLPRFQRPQGERPPREAMPELTEDERAEMRARFQERMVEQLRQQAESGNAQSGGLRQEMMKRGGGRGGFGGGRGGEGGGQRGR